MKQEIAVIFLLWFALQIPLGIFIGKCIHFGMSEARNTRRQASSPSGFSQGVTKWWHGSAVLLGWRGHNVPSIQRAGKYHRR